MKSDIGPAERRINKMEDESITAAEAIDRALLGFAEIASLYCGEAPDNLLPVIEITALKFGEPTWKSKELL